MDGEQRLAATFDTMLAMRRTWNAAPVVVVFGLVIAGCSEEEAAPASQPSDLPPTARADVHEQFLADLAAVRDASDGGGSVRLVLADGDDGSVMCATSGRWQFEFTAGPLGIAQGGSLTFLSPPFWGWSTPQTQAELRPGFTVVECDAAGVELEAWTADKNLLQIEVKGRALAPGEVVRITYGAGQAGALADTYAERESRFYFKVDGDGDGISALLAETPSITVHPGPAARIVATLPSTAWPGEAIQLRLAVLDIFANSGVSYVGDVQLESLPAGLDLPESVSFEASSSGLAQLNTTVQGEGTYRVRATLRLEDGREDTWTSNPLRVREGLRRVYWGDLHGHSGLSDGTGTPADYFAYARDVAALDLAVLTDHDHFGVRFMDATPKMWEEIRAEVERVTRPGEFVALLGYEWTSWLHGHRHVLYFDGEGEVHSSMDAQTMTPRGLWDALAGREALTIAHHSAGGPVATDWSFAPDPWFEPVTEVMSVHGSSEAWDSPSRIYSPVRGNFVRDQLERGVVFGFIGSGDSHDGHPGHAHLAPNAGYRKTPPDPRGRRASQRLGNGGLAAVRAESLEPSALLAAFRARDVYATSGPRILLATSLAGHMMGSEVSAKKLEESAKLALEVAACSGLERIEIIRKERPIERVPCHGELDAYYETSLPGLKPGDFVYVRVLQNDGGLAWSSPFYITE